MVFYDDCYLLFKHFPVEFTDEDKVDFLKYFGAIDVKCISSNIKKGNVCFARFPTKESTKEVLNKLHQSEILGQLISVEFVRGSDLNQSLPSFVQRTDESEEKDNQNKYYEQFLSRLSSWTNTVDFHRPPPVHLRYQYPAPTLAILTNIARTLYKVPKLYTQTLHLMNKMNLPCPLDDDFPIDCDIYVVDSLKPYTELSEGESEIEDDDTVPRNEILPNNLSILKRRRKAVKIKRHNFIKPIITSNQESSIKPVVQTSEIFDTVNKEINLKKIEVKVTADLSSIKESKQEEAVEIESFAPLDLPKKISDKEEIETDETYRGKVISEEELNSNRISARDQRILPVFKNYQAGTPSCRLYIKNLAKNVVVDELHYIYRRYYEEREEEQGIMYDIRLMQEGRMKGQAFVTLQGVEQAQKALEETNGFVVRGKPMVVQFARSAKQKSDNKMEVDT